MVTVTYSLIKTAGGLISRTRKFFGSAKSAIRNVATGFFVPGFGYLKNEINIFIKQNTLQFIEYQTEEILKEKLFEQRL